MKRCLGCMEEYEDGFSVCPHCGFVEGTQPEEAIHMIPGTMLNNRFIIGKVVGFGGFGVTYLAWDTVLQHRVAIKEYLPSEFSTRIPGQTQITVFNGEKGEQYLSGMQRFVEEAKKLAKFNDAQGIVKIYDSFTENDTAYIVMEYLEGETLDKILKREKTIPPEQAVQMLMPIMESLKRVHKEGIIHRDIAPDNVMVTVDGEMKLIDFGAARYATTSHSRSLTVIIKPGYSPEEQYRSRGDQGAHTDVYAVGAMLYRMITGITPPDAFERRAFFESKKKDILEPITKYCKNIPENIENAILNAMNVRIEDRSKDMTVLVNELTSEEPVKRVYGKIKKIDVLKWPLWAKIAVPLAACTVMVLGVLFAMGIIGFKSDLQNEIVIPDGMTRVPSLVNRYLSDGEQNITDASLMYTIEGKEYSAVIPKDYVLWQSVNPGYITEVNTIVGIKVSGGPELRELPSVEGYSKEEAEKMIKEAGFEVSFLEEYDNVIPAGYVISQSEQGGQYIPMGSEIQLLISKGKDPAVEFEEKLVKVPSFVGLTYAEALQMASQSGISVAVQEKKYSNEYAVDVIMAQNVAANSEVSNTEIIQLTVSLGIRYVKVPDVQFMTEEQAKVLLDENELAYEFTYETSETVKEGLVISQSIEDGEMVEPQTKVSIVVSKGRGSFEMPDVEGEKESEAKKTLTGKGLVVTVTYENNETVASGNVISQSVAKGTEVTAGTAVSIVVSSGEKLYTVPDVTGKDRDTAVEELEDLTFEVQVNEAYDENVEKGLVVSQTLAAGTQHKKETDIIITISKGKQPLTITFNPAGGECDAKPITVYLNGTYGELPVAEKEYFTFDGWYTAETGGTKVEASTVVSEKTDQILYAHWVRNTVSIIYDMGDGTVYNQVGAFQGDNYDHPTDPSKQYYTFNGWFTEREDGSQIKDGDLITATGSQRLYAQWTRNTLNVTFNANGGSSNSSSTLNQGDKYTLPAEPTRTGYKFDGWYTATSGGTKITNTTSVEKTGSETLYAQWTPITYTIKYNGNGSTSGSMASSTHTYDVKKALTANKFARTGYQFLGWSTESKATEAGYADGCEVWNRTDVDGATFNLYAVWKVNTYTVNLNANGGTCSTSSIKVNYGGTYTGLPTNPTRTGYTFAGWYTATSGGSKITSSSTVSITSNQTLYARWTANTYTVTLNANGGTCSTSSIKVSYAGKYTNLPTNPSRTGYTFAGWYTATSGGSKITSSSTVSITSNQTLYARWTSNTYTIVYNGNGSTTGSMSNVTHTYDVSKTLTSNAYKRTYYTFTGWNTKADGSGTSYKNGASVKNLTSTNGGKITLYAQWTKNEWSDWSDTAPNVDTSTYTIQYRYMDLQYTSWVTQWYTESPGTDTLLYKPTGNTKKQWNYFGYTFYAGETYFTYCLYANNLGYSPSYIESGWIDSDLTATFDSYDAYTTHNCGHADCPAVQGQVYGYTWKYGSNRYYLRWERTLYEYKTRTSYWPSSWSASTTTVISASSTRKVQYRYIKN